MRRLVIVGAHSWSENSIRGGEWRVLASLAERLSWRIDVCVCTANVTRRVSLSTLWGSVAYVPRGRDRVTGLVRTLLWLRREMRTSDTVGILASDVVGCALSAVASRLWGCRYVAQVQGEVLYPGEQYGSRLRRLALGLVMRHAVRHATAVRCVNPHLVEQIRGLDPKAVVSCVGTRVDTQRFRPGPGPVCDGPVISCVASLVPLKKQAVLVRALKLLQARDRRVVLQLMGAGPEERRIRDLAEELGVEAEVIFRGVLGHDEVAAELQKSTVFAFPSATEGQPRAVLEAMASGLPVVLSDILAHRSIITDGVHGFLVDGDTPESWAAAIQLLLDNHERAAALGAAARQLAVDVYDYEHQLDRLASFLRLAFPDVRC